MLGSATTIDFSGVTLPFTVNDMLSAAMNLVKLFGPFVLLGLAVAFAPKIINLFRKGASAGGGKN